MNDTMESMDTTRSVPHVREPKCRMKARSHPAIVRVTAGKHGEKIPNEGRAGHKGAVNREVVAHLTHLM